MYLQNIMCNTYVFNVAKSGDLGYQIFLFHAVPLFHDNRIPKLITLRTYTLIKFLFLRRSTNTNIHFPLINKKINPHLSRPRDIFEQETRSVATRSNKIFNLIFFSLTLNMLNAEWVSFRRQFFATIGIEAYITANILLNYIFLRQCRIHSPTSFE